MPPIRVLLVDDAATVRRVVGDVLAEDPALEIAGTASDGRMGLERIETLHPDVVLLDLDMPVMGGLEMLAALRARHPSLPVVVYSALTREGAPLTMQALWMGANDVVVKPAGGLAATRMLLRNELIPRLKALAGRGTEVVSAKSVLPLPRAARPGGRAEVVVIGASTGGPRTLVAVLGGLPATLSAAVLVVQHMPPTFMSSFTEGLAARVEAPVREACDGEPLEPGAVLVAPGGRQCVVRRENGTARVRLTDDAPEHGCRPALDPLLRSVAASHGASALAVVLTGMGSDGRDGCASVRAAGGAVLVQDRATSVVWGMPGLVAEAGLADAELPPAALAVEIARRTAVSAARRAA
jgi:two-component system chemotaxis response regulator CheB